MKIKLKKGWIAKDKDGSWFWYKKKPEINLLEGNWSCLLKEIWRCKKNCVYLENEAFKIDFKGSWKDSLMEVGEDEVG